MHRSEKLLGIQFCRGIAALLVVLYHAGRMLALPQYLGHIAAGGIFNFGNAGVDFFFVLSGFIISFVHGRDVGQPSRLPAYIWSRLTRIYPPYWFVTAIVVALAIAANDTAVLEPVHLVKSILLVPQAREPVLQVGWTLVYEMLFYALFAIAIASRTAAGVVAAAWVASIVAAMFLVPRESPFYSVASYQIQFALGVAIAFAVRRRIFPLPAILACLGLAAFALAAYSLDTHAIVYASMECRCLLGLASALIIYGVARLETEGRLKVAAAPAFLGSASYSIYLVHTIAIGLFAKLLVLTHLMTAMAPNAIFFLTACVAAACGGVLYLVVERPMLGFAKAHAPSR